ncbi:hypothetical protein DITRI_Ditri19aG0080700 [Diplodiscus trichospermus]
MGSNYPYQGRSPRGTYPGRLRPPMTGNKARKMVHKGINSGEKGRNWGNSIKELTQKILRFREAYKQAESAKLQQVVEMEKQRMEFCEGAGVAKDIVFHEDRAGNFAVEAWMKSWRNMEF